MNKLEEVWRKDRSLILCVAAFSAVYITVGYLWFLAPQSKFHPGHVRTTIELIAPMLGLAVPFLNGSPYVFVPGLAIAGGIAGWITKLLLGLRWPNKLLGAALWIAIGYINFQVGLFLYGVAVLIW